jgi:antitoxin component of MazEF toxin-antitoxin module
MLAKLTSKNQITLPKALVNRLEATEYFDVQLEGGRLVLTPVRPQSVSEVRAKLEKLGISETDVSDAVAWARRQRK